MIFDFRVSPDFPIFDRFPVYGANFRNPREKIRSRLPEVHSFFGPVLSHILSEPTFKGFAERGFAGKP